MILKTKGWKWTPRAFVMLAAMLALGAWVHRGPLLDILRIGIRDEEQSHILLVPLIAMWLLWRRRSRLRYVRLRPSPIGLVFVTCGAILSWWGFGSGTQIAWHAGAGLALVGVVLSMTGLEPVRQFLPVLVVLLFALPVPGALRQAIAMPLQTLATSATHALLELFGVAATRFGNILVINNEQIAVGEACNGMRMVFALVLVAYAFVFSSPLKMTTRFVLLALSPLVALICNVVRLIPTSLVLGYSSGRTEEWLHDVTGWMMMPVALGILAILLRFFRWLDLPVASFRLAAR